MADCDIRLPQQLAQVMLPADSPVFQLISDLIGSIDVGVSGLSLPHIGNFELGANVGTVSTTLRAPTEPSEAAPVVPGVTAGGLQRATYSALRSTLEFSYASPLIPALTYAQGLGHLTMPDVSVAAPPVNYPVEALLDVPARPDLPDATAPEITLGQHPALEGVNTITFSPDVLEPLPLPDMSFANAADPLLNLPELPYRGQVTYDRDAALLAKLRELLQGRDEIAHWLIDQVVLFASDTRHLKVEVKRAVDKVFEQAAARNFALPTGMVDAQVAQIVEDEVLQRRQALEKIEAEVVDAALQTLLVSLRSVADIERYRAALYLEYARQNLELYKLNAATGVATYNALVAIHSAYAQIVAQHVDNYNRYVAAVADQNRAQLAQADVIDAQLATHRAQVTMFRADAATLRNIADVQNISVRTEALPLQTYAAELQGVVANFSIFDTNVRAYKQAVQNYARAFALMESKVTAYDAAIRAEASKGDVEEANLRAYARALAAEKQRVGSYEEYVRASTAALETEMSNFRAAMSAERSYMSAVTDILSANMRALQSYMTIAQAQQETVSSYNTAQIGYLRNKDRLALAIEELRLAQQAIQASSIAQQARLQSALSEIRVRAGGALAQAASTIYNVGVSASGTASENVHGYMAASQDTQYSDRYAWAKVCRQEVRELKG